TVVPVTRRELDVTRPEAVMEVAADVMPDLIVNCSAYTDVDRAEDEPVTAFDVNALAVRALAHAAIAIDATLVHYSTDFVFDGRIDRPYTEDDAPNPRGTYAMSKLLGEWFAAQVPRHYVLRVESLFGGARARSSVDRILPNLRAEQPVRALSDRSGAPSCVDAVIPARAGLLRVEAPAVLYPGVDRGWSPRSGLARDLARLVGRPEALVEDIRMAALKLKAERPRFAALSNEKLTAAGVSMPSWQDAMRRYVQDTQ